MSKADPLDVACRLVASAREEKPQELREVAGVLALLDLLGIVDAFYGEAAGSQTKEPQVIAGMPGPVSDRPVSAGGTSPPDTGGQVSDSERRGDREGDRVLPEPATVGAGPAQDGAPGPAGVASSLLSSIAGMTAKEKGLDPRLITSLLGLLTRVSAQKSSSGQDVAQGSEAETDGEKASLAAMLDPKFITLVLNFLAALSKGGGEESRPGRGGPPGPDLEVSVDSSGTARFDKPAVSPPTASRTSRPPSRLFAGAEQTRGHKPGHGILRSPFITPRRPSYLDGKG